VRKAATKKRKKKKRKPEFISLVPYNTAEVFQTLQHFREFVLEK